MGVGSLHHPILEELSLDVGWIHYYERLLVLDRSQMMPDRLVVQGRLNHWRWNRVCQVGLQLLDLLILCLSLRCVVLLPLLLLLLLLLLHKRKG